MRRGIFIGRFQPFHIGHLSVLYKMDNAKVLDELIIGIGSAQIDNTAYNPFTAKEREEMIRQSVTLKKPYHIVKINDIYNYPKWVSYVERLTPKFQVVYAENTVVKRLFNEKGYEVRSIPFLYGISATIIRKMMIRDGGWGNYIPEKTQEIILKINGIKRLKSITGEYMKPSVTVDIIIDYKKEGIILIKRKNEPFKNCWALPGGFLEVGQETTENAAIREAKEETSLDIKLGDLTLFGVYSKPERDPRGPTVTIVYSTKVNEGVLKGADDALEAKVFNQIPDNLAFDHNEILMDYVLNT